MTINAEEKKIVKGCKAGKAKYQQLLYERYYGKMLSLCMRYTNSRDEAKDVLHDGYVKVFKSIKNFKGQGSLEGWVRKIMVNTAINNYHKSKKNHSNIYIEDDLHPNPVHDFQEDEVISKMSYDDLLQLVKALPPAYRTVFNLYAIEGYNHREISVLLNISEGTSKSNLAKARIKLQNRIQDSMDGKLYEIYVQKT